MFRPLKLLGRNAVKIVTVHSHRSKIIFTESFLDKAERMKLWNTENKQLFGCIIKDKKAVQKEKRKKVTKSAKESSTSKDADSCYVPVSSKPKKSGKKTLPQIDSIILTNKDFIISPDKDVLLDSVMKSATTNDSANLNYSKYMFNNKKHPVEIVSSNIKNGILSASNFAVPSIIARNLRLFPMMSNQKANVADSSSEEVQEEKILQVRSTNIEHNKLPSVTKILEQTMSPESREALEKWRQEKIAELGPEEFEKYYQAQLSSGSRFHELLSKRLVSPHECLTIEKQIQGVWTSVGHVLKDIKSTKAVESHVVHPVLKYKGVIDCVAVYQDKPMLIEWKKSDKPKQTLSATYDNPIQLAAYFGAISHDPNYKRLNVRDALLVIAYTDGSPADSYHLNMDQMRQHWAAWLTRLERFWAEKEKKKASEVATPVDGSDDKSAV